MMQKCKSCYLMFDLNVLEDHCSYVATNDTLWAINTPTLTLHGQLSSNNLSNICLRGLTARFSKQILVLIDNHWKNGLLSILDETFFGW